MKSGDSLQSNRYIYVKNNPVAYLDKSGENPLLAIAAATLVSGIIGGIGGAISSKATTGKVKAGAVVKGALTGVMVGAVSSTTYAVTKNPQAALMAAGFTAGAYSAYYDGASLKTALKQGAIGAGAGLLMGSAVGAVATSYGIAAATVTTAGLSVGSRQVSRGVESYISARGSGSSRSQAFKSSIYAAYDTKASKVDLIMGAYDGITFATIARYVQQEQAIEEYSCGTAEEISKQPKVEDPVPSATEIKKPAATTPEVQKPTVTPEVKKPATATEVKKPVATPEVEGETSSATKIKEPAAPAKTATQEGLVTEGGSGTKPDYYVTPDGVAFKNGIPDNYVENPYRNGSYGVFDENGKFIEKLRIDPATPTGKKGPSYSHYHIDGGKEHFSPRPSDDNPLGF